VTLVISVLMCYDKSPGDAPGNQRAVEFKPTVAWTATLFAQEGVLILFCLYY